MRDRVDMFFLGWSDCAIPQMRGIHDSARLRTLPLSDYNIEPCQFGLGATEGKLSKHCKQEIHENSVMNFRTSVELPNVCRNREDPKIAGSKYSEGLSSRKTNLKPEPPQEEVIVVELALLKNNYC